MVRWLMSCVLCVSEHHEQAGPWPAGGGVRWLHPVHQQPGHAREVQLATCGVRRGPLLQKPQDQQVNEACVESPHIAPGYVAQCSPAKGKDDSIAKRALPLTRVDESGRDYAV